MRLTMILTIVLMTWTASRAEDKVPGEAPKQDIDGSVSVATVLSEKMFGSLKIPKPEDHPEAVKAAGDIAERVNSPEFQKKIEAERLRIVRDVLPGMAGAVAVSDDPVAKQYPDMGKRGMLDPGERVYVFISFSMPVETLRNYAKSAALMADPNVIFVMRGFDGGIRNIVKSQAKLRSVMQTDPSCQSDCRGYRVNAIVSPMLFGKYGIGRVPAVVYVRGAGALEGFEPDMEITEPEFWVVYGDESLPGILREINDRAKSPALAVKLERR